MKNATYLIALAIFTLTAEEDCPNFDPLLTLLALKELNIGFRAPTPPNFLGFPIGSLNFQGYNGGAIDPYTIGARIGGYSALPTPTTPTANQTFPANIIMSTIGASGAAESFRLSVQANGRVGIGNFAPTNTTTANAALNVEGATGTAAASTVHVGSRTTPIIGFTGMTGTTGVNYNMQVDGNLVVPTRNTTLLVNNATTPAAVTGISGLSLAQGRLNLAPYTFIRTIPSTGISIESPGIYCLANNITYLPDGNAAPAITINSSNVVLDLQSFNLSQGNTQAFVYGVQIAGGVSDIMIMNGTISNFTEIGVFAQVGLSSLNRIALQDLTMISCGRGAFNLDGGLGGSNDIYINNCKAISCAQTTGTIQVARIASIDNVFINGLSIVRCGATTLNGLEGLFLSTVSNANIQDVAVSNCQARGLLRGINVSIVNGGQLLRCHVMGSLVSTGTSSALRGIEVSGCSGLVFENCTSVSNSNTGTATSGISGFFIDGSTKCSFSQCVGGGNTTTVSTQTPYSAFGMFANSGCSSLSVEDCTFYRNGTSSATSGSVGIQMDGNNSVFTNCVVHTQTHNGSDQAIGIVITAAATTGLNNFFNGCNVFNNATGFQLTLSGGTNTQNRFLKNVSAFNNVNTTVTLQNYINFPTLPTGSTTTASLSNLDPNLNGQPWTNIDFL